MKTIRRSTIAMLWVCSSSWTFGCGSTSSVSSEREADERSDASVDAASADASRRDAGRADARVDAASPARDPQDGTCAAITRDAPVQRGAVDVLWVVDNSPSMLDDIAGVTANMQSFFTSIEGSGADVHIITISAADLALGTPLQSDASKYRFVFHNVRSEEVFDSTLSTFAAYQDFLRPDAATQIVAVTDDEDEIPSATFLSSMRQQLGHEFTLHAIVADRPLCGAGVGNQYLAAADQTGGKKISLCGGDWTAVINELTSAVVAAVPLPCSYDLAEAATSTADFDPSEVAVDYTPADQASSQELPKSSSADKCADKLGWYYDSEAAPTKLELCPAACELVKGGGKMAIAFGCAPTTFL